MSRLARTLLGVVLAALILVTGASSISPAPTLLRPTANESIAAGTPIIFQIQTFAGDDPDYLSLRVSRSPVAVVHSCGTIGGDVYFDSFTATADPSVFQAVPYYDSYLSNWMNQSGTYYWQAYRQDANGCVESEVHSFTITGTPPVLIPPTLLSPAPGQIFRAGTKIGFRIRTHADDADLYLQISRSKKQDTCGLIGVDVYSQWFSASSDPSIYVAKPPYEGHAGGEGGWMDKPGTYYWQAYRLGEGGCNDANGYIESEVHSFKIKFPPPKSLAAARLDGFYNVKLKMLSSSIKDIERLIYPETWSFSPNCNKGACKAVGVYTNDSVTNSNWGLKLRRHGTLYKGTRREALLVCVPGSGSPWQPPDVFRIPSGPLSVSVRVTKGAWVDVGNGPTWRATKVKGTWKYSVRSTTSGGIFCPGGVLSATLKGTLEVQSSSDADRNF